MKRSTMPKRPSRTTPAHKGGRYGASPRRLTATQFLTRLKRGQLAQPQHAELQAGSAASVTPPTGQAAGVLARLQDQLAKAVAEQPVAIATRPLLRVSSVDLWRPHLGLLPQRHASALNAVGGSVEAGRLQLLVLLEARDQARTRLAGYAAAGVRELWVLDLCAAWTDSYRSPWAGSFQSRTLWYPGEGAPIAALPGVQVEALEEGFQPERSLLDGPECRGPS